MLMYNKFKVFLLGLGVFLGFFSILGRAEVASPATEIAILIDVSGSMKLNDPHNLRVPALKLLINVLPEQVKAGIWLFAERPSVLVPMAPVDAAWKQQALRALPQVNSNGLFTDIEAAMTAATASWSGVQGNSTRNVLLLTDGMVDVAKDAALNQASKTRIMTALLPKFQQQGVHLQTIALSGNADSQLLQKLASATQGWNETVASAEQLERMFLKMFKQAVVQPAVPLQQGNKFSIDPSIKEFSALVFRKSDKFTELLSPSKQRYSRGSQSKLVQWASESNYDLMTIKEPEPGEWQISADMDPDNQVTIVTDLQFVLDPLPKYFMKFSPIKFRAHFTDKGALITQDSLLKLIDVRVKFSDGVNEYPDLQLQADPTAPGYFIATLDQPIEKGSYLLKILADGKTFVREVNHTLGILESPISLSSEVDAEKYEVRLSLTPDAKVIAENSLSIQAQLNQLGQEPTLVDIPQHGDHWQFTVAAPSGDAQMIVNFSAKAKTLAGEEFTPEVQPFVVDAQLFAPVKPPAAVSEPKQAEHTIKPVSETEHATATLEAESHSPVEASDPGPNWLMSSVIALVINILCGLAAYFVLRSLKQKTIAKQAQLLGRLS